MRRWLTALPLTPVHRRWQTVVIGAEHVAAGFEWSPLADGVAAGVGTVAAGMGASPLAEGMAAFSGERPLVRRCWLPASPLALVHRRWLAASAGAGASPLARRRLTASLPLAICIFAAAGSSPLAACISRQSRIRRRWQSASRS